MGILRRGMDEIVMTLNNAKAQAADLNIAQEILPRGKWYLRDIIGKLTVAGVTAAQDVDVNDDTVTLLGGTKISFATTSLVPTYPTLGQVSALGGSVISLDNDTVHSGTAGEGLVVQMVWTRKPVSVVTNLGPE